MCFNLRNCMSISVSPITSQILWEEERAARELCQRQSFVDLGCGNGLLVYLLSCEGVCTALHGWR